MFAKQTVLSASLVALLGAALPARAEGEVSPQSTGEAHADDPLPEPRELPPAKRFHRRYRTEPTGTFSIGAGYSSDEGFLAAATIAQPDLFHTGHQLSMHARLSQRRELFLERYAIPELLGTQWSLSVDLYSDTRRLPAFTRAGTGAALTLAHPLGEHLRGFVSYRIEDVEIKDSSPVALRTVEPMPPLTGGLLSAVRAGWVYDTLDRHDAPLRGSNIGASLEVANGALGSDLHYAKFESWMSHHQPIGALTLHLSGSFTTLTDSFSTIETPGGPPRSERLFLNSSQDIRGYSPLTFGPVDSLGRAVGGDTKVLASAELEAPLVRRIGLSAIGFMDAGALFDRHLYGQAGHSVGVGLLWRSPIGALRFSWAVPLDGGKPTFCFSIGTW